MPVLRSVHGIADRSRPRMPGVQRMSFTSGKISHDPEPYLTGGLIDPRTKHPGHGRRVYAPRPEFDNHNPILVELRRCIALGSDQAAMVQVLRNWIVFGKAEKIPSSPAQTSHAWRVLTKLARLTETETA